MGLVPHNQGTAGGEEAHPATKRMEPTATRLKCPNCGELFSSDSSEVACPRCGQTQVRPAPGERFSERDPSGLVIATALNDSLKALKATQAEGEAPSGRKPR